MFAGGILVPDLSMVGYLSDPGTGAALYNIGHTETIPLLLLCTGLGQRLPRLISIALIWLAHINRKLVSCALSVLFGRLTLPVDRMIGAGLKYSSGFSDTHLGFWDGFTRQRI